MYKYGSGGVFLGEWLQGKMHGSGFMMYPGSTLHKQTLLVISLQTEC